MPEEEKEAMGWLSALDIKSEYEAINKELILNLIQKQQEEINHLKDLNKHQSNDITKAVNYTFELNKEIEEKDKIIDEMAGYLAIIRDCPNEDKGANIDCENRCKADDDIYAECWKLYFEREVEDK